MDLPDNGEAERFVETSLHEWAHAKPSSTSKDGTKPPITKLGLTPDSD